MLRLGGAKLDNVNFFTHASYVLALNLTTLLIMYTGFHLMGGEAFPSSSPPPSRPPIN